MTDRDLQMLYLSALSDGSHGGVTPKLGACLGEAAAICLEDQEHSSAVSFAVRGDDERHFSLEWEPVDEQARRSWADLAVATEQGACCLAILLVQELCNLIVLERSMKGTGFDYWLGPAGMDTPLFQEKVRLEVSGIRKGPEKIDARVSQKAIQIRRSADLGLEAIIVVVEFGTPQARMVRS